MPQIFPVFEDTRPSRYFITASTHRNGSLVPAVMCDASCSYKYSADKRTCYVQAKGPITVPKEYQEISQFQFDAI